MKMALSTTMAYLIVCAVTPPAFMPATHSRTCSGRMSIILIDPNSGRMRHLST